MLRNMFAHLISALKGAFTGADSDNVKDAVSLTMEKLHARPPAGLDPDSDSYFRYAVTACINTYRKMMAQKRKHVPLEYIDDLESDDNISHMIESEAMEHLLSKLTLNEREVFERKAFDGLTYKQIASELRLTVRTVKYRYTIARNKLRKYYGPPPRNNHANTDRS